MRLSKIKPGCFKHPAQMNPLLFYCGNRCGIIARKPHQRPDHGPWRWLPANAALVKENRISPIGRCFRQASLTFIWH